MAESQFETDAQSGTRKGLRNPGWANLIPPKPGEVRNPTGRNQYTVQKERFQEHIAKYLEENASHKELSRSEALALAVLEDALAGDATSRKETLARLWPIVSKAEVDVKAELEERAVKANFSLDNLTAEERKTVKRLMMKAIVKPLDKEDDSG